MRTLVVLGSLLVIGLLAWSLATASPTAMPSQPRGDAASAPAPAAATADSAEDAPTASERQAAPGRPRPEGAVPFRVRVVDRLTVEPVAGAEVRWTEDIDAQLARMDAAARRVHQRDWTLLAAASPWVACTDEAGEAELFVTRYSCHVIARLEGRFGDRFVTLASLAETPVLELEPDATLRVRVRREGGQPVAGVGVQLASTHDDGTTSWRFPDGTVRETGMDGIATFHHVQRFDRWRTGRRRGQPVASWSVLLRNAGLAGDARSVDPGALPDAPLEFVLPAAGTVRVLPRIAGRPVRLPLAWTGLGSLALYDPADERGTKHLRWREQDADGWVTFRDIGIGKTLALTNGEWSEDVPGPTRPGETVEHEVELAEHVFVLQAKVLAADGRPLAQTELGVGLFFAGSSSTSRHRTDAHGLLRVVCPLERGKADRTFERVAFTWQPSDLERQFATHTVEGEARGLLDLGTVTLRAVPLLVAGQLRHDQGHRGSVLLAIERHQPRRAAAGRDPWPIDHELDVQLDRDGSFCAFGEAPQARLRLRAMSDDHLPCAPVEFVPGERGVEIHLQRGGVLEARCKTPAALPDADLQVSLVAHEDGRARSGRLRAAEPTLRTARWQALPPGAYTVHATLLGMHGEPLLRSEPIEVHAGAAPHRVELDLREHVAEVALDLRAAGTGAPERALAFVGPAPADDVPWQARSIPLGEQVLVVPTGTSELLVAAPGFEPRSVRIEAGAATATLQPWPAASLTVTGLQSLPPDVEVRLHAVPVADRRRDPRRYTADWDTHRLCDLLEGGGASRTIEQGRARLPIGKHPLRLRLELEPGADRAPIPVQAFTPTILTTAGPHVVTVPPAEATRLLEALARDRE